MTHSEQEEVLRRALHAVADTIEPAADGLERIRERLSKPRPLAVAWLMAGWTGLVQPLLLRMEPVLAGAAGRLVEWQRLMIRSLGAAGERLRPAGVRLRPGVERLRPAGELLVNAIRMLRPGSGMSRHEKLRSALAFAAAALIGAAGGFALSDGLPQSMISTVGSVFASSQPHHASGSGRGTGLSKTAQPYAPTPGTAPGSTHKTSATPSPTCSPTPKPSVDPSPTPKPSVDPSPTSPSPTSPSPTSPSPTSPSPTSPSPTSPSPTPPALTQAGPGSTPAQANASASSSTGVASSSATNRSSRSVAGGSAGARPAATTAKPTATSACG